LIQQRRLLQAEQRRAKSDAVVRQAALQQMESAIGGLQQGLSLVNATLDALSVRAPVAGRLTGFRLQVGETMRPDQHLGRIDDPEHFKLTAQADEFYLQRMSAGRRGLARLHERDYAVEVKVIYPQIKEGRFSFELEFVDAAPAAISPGQSLDVQITLGAETQAMVLDKGAFLNDSGGAWVFVMSVDGHHAQRRNVVLGRRSAGQVEVLSGLAPGDKVIVSSYAGFGQATALQFTQ
jgi:HlyD family secretion protein